MSPWFRILSVAVLTAVLSACGGGGDSPSAPAAGGSAAPVIASAPAAQSVTAGQTATFSVTASGSGTLSYQWLKNGAEIAGATASNYTTAATVSGDNGAAYAVKVTNANGTTTSASAVLTVSPVAGGGQLTTIAASQDTANKAVQSVNQGVATLRQADAASSLPGGAFTRTLPGGASIQQSLACATLGTGGSGTIDFTINVDDATQRPTTSTFNYNNCSFQSVGYSASFNGTGALTYSNYVSAESFTYSLTFNMSYNISSGGVVEQGTLNSTEVCTISAAGADCRFQVGDALVDNVTISTSGSVTTISSGSIDSSTIDCVYTGYTYDGATGRATSGSVTVTDAQGNQAVVTASATGYTVVITVNGQSSTWTVAFSS